MFFFPFLLVGLAGSFIDSVTTRLLDPVEFVGFALGGMSIILSWIHRPSKWEDLGFGVIAFLAAACIDTAISDLFLDEFADWSPVVMIPVSIIASVMCILFCVWWINDRYGFDLMVISSGFNSWPTSPRRTSDAIVHQVVYFLSAALLEVGVHEIMMHAHWLWSLLAGIICLLLLGYVLRMSPTSLALYTLASSGFDVAISASMWTLSQGNVWIQFYLGMSSGLILLFFLFGTAYVVSPKDHRWKSLKHEQ